MRVVPEDGAQSVSVKIWRCLRLGTRLRDWASHFVFSSSFLTQGAFFILQGDFAEFVVPPSHVFAKAVAGSRRNVAKSKKFNVVKVCALT